MLITSKFVMLNFPKTGSTFARSVLKELHGPRGPIDRIRVRLGSDLGLSEKLVVPYRFMPERHNYPSQHGVFVQIPPQHRDKTVMSILRDPLEKVVSAFEFRHWARYQEDHLDALRVEFPNFPDLSFAEYLDYSLRVKSPTSLPEGALRDIGPLTTQFIRFFAKDPMRTILSLRDGMDLAAERDAHFVPVRFLHMENLREELAGFLKEMGYPEERLGFILDKPRENTTDRSRSEYLTPAAIQRLLHAERFFYQLFPEYLPKGH